MNEVILELDREGVRSFLRGEEMQKACREQAETLRARCGEGYAVDSYTGKNRVNAMLWPATEEARLDHYRHNTVEKALGGKP